MEGFRDFDLKGRVRFFPFLGKNFGSKQKQKQKNKIIEFVFDRKWLIYIIFLAVSDENFVKTFTAYVKKILKNNKNETNSF